MTVRNVASNASVVGFASVLLVLAIGAQQQQGGENCPGLRWSAPVEWRSPEGYAMYLSMPLIAPIRDGTLWLGQLLSIRKGPNDFLWPFVPPGATAFSNSTEVQIGAVVARDGSVRYVPMPADLRNWLESPRAVVDKRGITHLLWAPSDSNHPRQVLYARFDGERWSVPRVAAEDKKFFWNPASVSPLAVRGDTLDVIVTARDGLLYLRGVNGRWVSHPVDIWHGAAPGGYPNLTILPGGRLVVLAQGPALDTPRWKKPGLQLTSRVFATRSDDDGVTWAPVTPVSALGTEPAVDFHLVQSHDGVLRALWYQMTDTLGNAAEDMSLGGSPGRVHIAESRDGGVSWHRLAASHLLRFSESLDAQMIDDSTVAVVLVDRAAEQVLLTTWSNGWRPFAHIDARPNPQQTIFGRDDAQRLVLTWGSERGAPRWFLSMVTTLTPCR